jgi:tetratricopeptide (TPR) repeat protein
VASYLSAPIDVLKGFVGKRDIRWLKRNGIKTVEVLASMDPVELCKLPGFKSAPLGYCRGVVEEAKRYLEALKRFEEARKMYRGVWSAMPSFTEMLSDLLKTPLFILAPTDYFVHVTEKHAGAVGYCVKLYALSLMAQTLEILAERCYSSYDEARKEFDEATKLLKQRLGDLICVQNVDGDCFERVKHLLKKRDVFPYYIRLYSV